MKHLINLLVLLFFFSATGINAQTRVQVGDLYYNLSGTSASVKQNPNGKYEKDEYVIPQSVIYNGLDFTVNAIESYAFNSSNVKTISLPNTISSIGAYAFSNCKNLTSVEKFPNSIIQFGPSVFNNCSNLTTVIIPKSVQEFISSSFSFSEEKNPFYSCNLLREIIYLPHSAPLNWTATSMTYVPDINAYSSPQFTMNNAHVIEMISFEQTEFEYTGKIPSTAWKNNVEGYTALLNIPTLKADVGSYEEWIPVTFSKGDVSFTAEVPYRYTIKPEKLTAKVINVSREYGEDNPQINISYSGFVNGENESVITTKPTTNITATKTSDAGEYPITISGGSAKNYEFVYEPGVLTVNKAALSAKVSDATKVYGSKNPAFTIEYYGLKNGETAPTWSVRPSFSTDATQSSNVGKYSVSAINAEPINYNLGQITSGTLNVTPAPLVIKANNVIRQYYNDDPNFTYSYSGFVNGDNESVLSQKPILSTITTRTSNVGTYEINVSGAESPNYSISYINGTLTITPRTLTASVGNYSRLYNEDNPAFEIKYDGFVGNDNENVLIEKPITTTSATKTSDVGSYTISVIGGSADNYNFSYSLGSITINKAEQTISWNQDLNGLNVGDQVELKAEASSGLPITYSMEFNNAAEIYSAGSKNYLDCKAGGQFAIRAVQEGNKNYYSTSKISKSVSIVGISPSNDPTLTIKQADNGTVSVQLTKGSVYTFTIAPSNGWRIHSVTFNNSNVTNQLTSDGQFTTPAITGNSTLSVVYEEGSSIVSSLPESLVKIQETSYGARITDAIFGDLIQVYTLDGILLNSVNVEGNITDVPLDKNNVYIIKVGNKTVKLSH